MALAHEDPPNSVKISSDTTDRNSLFVKWGQSFEARASGWGIAGLVAFLGALVALWWSKG